MGQASRLESHNRLPCMSHSVQLINVFNKSLYIYVCIYMLLDPTQLVWCAGQLGMTI